VVELEPGTFHVKRRVFASRATWSESQNTWLLESGWVRDFEDGKVSNYQKFKATALSELAEPPSYFNREVLQAFQLSFRQLGSYIQELRNAGFDVSTLTVQWYVKIAFPLIAPVSMLLAIPYAFRVGARGAVGGVAVGLALGIAYWSLARLLQAMGGVGQLPPPFAAFAPDLIFYFSVCISSSKCLREPCKGRRNCKMKPHNHGSSAARKFVLCAITGRRTFAVLPPGPTFFFSVGFLLEMPT
jgi:hypothetical protein